ncbi:hypothetical protein D3C72_2437250 [compost metagenome]
MPKVFAFSRLSALESSGWVARDLLNSSMELGGVGSAANAASEMANAFCIATDIMSLRT